MGLKDAISSTMDLGSQFLRKADESAASSTAHEEATVTPGRVIAIGDIHGCSLALNYLLELLEPDIADTVITLGDYVDRGPDAKGVIDTLLAFQSQCHLVCLRGNHEEIMVRSRDNLKVYRSWYNEVGGGTTLYSYSGKDKKGLLRNVPDAHWEFLTKTIRNFYETKTHMFVHATALPNLPLASQPMSALHWERFDKIKPHKSGKKIVCGHTAQRDALPVNLGYAINIDTYAYGKGGFLSAFDVGSGLIYQANQDGQMRYGNIEDFKISLEDKLAGKRPEKVRNKSCWTPISTMTT